MPLRGVYPNKKRERVMRKKLWASSLGLGMAATIALSHKGVLAFCPGNKRKSAPCISWLLHPSSAARSERIKRQRPFCKSTTVVAADANEFASTAILAADVMHDYAPVARSLFDNMKLPAAVVTAGMISLGFATRFPELPKDTLDKVYPSDLRRRCAQLERLHVAVALASVTSELVVVLWAAVEVNQLTERAYAPALSVWDLIERDADLAWSAVNSHFILGIIGFTSMLWLRAYVMLLAANASRALMTAAATGTAAALCLMISVVNRGVEAGGGNGARYGSTVIDLFRHYAMLLFQAAKDVVSPGPLQMSAIVLEVTSLFFLLYVLVTESDAEAAERLLDSHDDACPVDDTAFLTQEELAMLSVQEREKLETCTALRAEEDRRQQLANDFPQELLRQEMEREEEQSRLDEDSHNSTVNIV